jgi:hypothetical protein
VSVSFAKIEDRFNRVFGFIRHDLKQILTLTHGGNFAAATLVACACEPLARYWLRTGDGAAAFAKLLPDGRYQIVAKTLYDSLRNGFVHHYGCRDLKVGTQIVQLGISWRERQHLSVATIEGRQTLLLNVRDLCRDLFKRFDEYRELLEESPDARDHFVKTFNRIGVMNVTRPGEIEAWRSIVEVRTTR